MRLGNKVAPVWLLDLFKIALKSNYCIKKNGARNIGKEMKMEKRNIGSCSSKYTISERKVVKNTWDFHNRNTFDHGLSKLGMRWSLTSESHVANPCTTALHDHHRQQDSALGFSQLTFSFP